MQDKFLKHYVDAEMKQIEVTKEAHKALKLEAADRDMPLKILANDILEGWLDSHRPGWREAAGIEQEQDENEE